MTAAEKLTVTTTGSTEPIVVAAGDIDSHTCVSLEEALGAVPDTAPVKLDLSHVDFVDSSGLRVIVSAHKRQLSGGGELVISSMSEAVRKLLDITGLAAELRLA